MKIIYILFALLIFLTGCEKKYSYVSVAKDFNAKADKEKQLSETYKDYWEYSSTKNFKEAYRYEISYQRFVHPLSWYLKFNKANYKGYQIELVSMKPISDEVYDVETKFTYQEQSYTYTDRWYLIAGKWEHTMKTSLLPEIN